MDGRYATTPARGGPSPALPEPGADLLDLTAALVAIPSVSRAEAELAGRIEAALRLVPWLSVERVGDNVVARTNAGRQARVVLAGHLDTVPPDGNEAPRIEGDTLWGLGAADMKGGLAVMLDLARTVAEPAVDVTYVFYAGEEIAAEHNGLRELFASRPDLVRGDVALLGEPTGATLEAGCQGTLRMDVTLRGARAHTARPWMGRNAIHRLGKVLTAVAAYEARQPVLAGCTFREALQAVAVTGGGAGNVVPDRVELTLNHRFAPDRSVAEAAAHVHDLLGPHLDPGDDVRLVDAAPAAAPAVDHPLVAGLVSRHGLAVSAKLGWTDVARFAEHGMPAANFGPGDSALAHRADERVTRADLERCRHVLADLLSHDA